MHKPTILPQLARTHAASAAIRRLTDIQKQTILKDLATEVLANQALIITQNKLDLDRMDDTDPKKDRLLLNEKRIAELAQAIEEVALLPDPSGQLLAERTLPNGLHLQKIAVPLGVVGIIYESRPNVTLDVTSLCIRSGNGVVLRGGSDAYQTNTFLLHLIHKVLKAHNVPTDAITLLQPDRELVKEMLTATRYIDIIIPRGSEGLIQFVRQHSLVPTIETGAGVCHTYVHTQADITKATAIVVNAKVSRPSVCNALDTVVVDNTIAEAFLPTIIPDFTAYQVEIFADERAYSILQKAGYSYLQKAQTSDFGREFLSYKCSIKTVDNFNQALYHIQQYSSRHSEAIVSENVAVCQQFIQEIDAAAVYANASTRFTDGGAFGLGAEIGISTQKLHARGPFALEKLVTEKWIIVGSGQVR